MKGIVTLCGSVRFEKEFKQVTEELTKAGWIVLGPVFFSNHKAMHNPEMAELKTKMDKLHIRRVRISEYVVIINKDKYIGISTSREQWYATKFNKTILFYHSKTWKQLLRGP